MGTLKKVAGVVGAITIGAIGYGVYNYFTRNKKKDTSSNSSNDTPTQSSDTSSSGTGKSTSKKKSTSNEASTPPKVKHEQAEILKPDIIYLAPVQYSVQRAGLEVYKTNEEKYAQYISPYNENSIDVTQVNVISDSDASEHSASVFKLHRGQIQDTYYYGNLISINYENDYKDMKVSGTINRESVNLQQFYKGVRIGLRNEWEAPNTTLEWEDMAYAIEGFITEQTFKEKNVDIKLEGFTKLFEQTLPFKFTEMYRSEILREIILTAGLQPMINAEGLDDDITDFTNEVKTESSSGSNPIGESSGNIAELAKDVCKGKTTDRAKAEAIHTYIRNHVNYPSPNYTNHRRCPTEVLRTGISNCCDRARLGHEMANAVGLYNRGVLSADHGHVWVEYKINGQWVASDPGVSRPKLGAIWNNGKFGRVWEFPSCK